MSRQHRDADKTDAPATQNAEEAPATIQRARMVATRISRKEKDSAPEQKTEPKNEQKQDAKAAGEAKPAEAKPKMSKEEAEKLEEEERAKEAAEDEKETLVAMVKGKLGGLEMDAVGTEAGFMALETLGMAALATPTAIIGGPALAILAKFQAGDRQAEIERAETMLQTLEEIDDPAQISWLLERFSEWHGDLELLNLAVGDMASKTEAPEDEKDKDKQESDKDLTASRVELLQLIAGVSDDPKAEDELRPLIFGLTSQKQIESISKRVLQASGLDAAQLKMIVAKTSAGETREAAASPVKQLGGKPLDTAELVEHVTTAAESIESTGEALEAGGGHELPEAAGAGEHVNMISVVGGLAKVAKLIKMKGELDGARDSVKAGQKAEQHAAEIDKQKRLGKAYESANKEDEKGEKEEEHAKP